MPTSSRSSIERLRAAFWSMSEMEAQRLGELEADREARVEARRRLLEDHRDVAADDLAACALGERQHVVSGEAQALRAHAAGNATRPISASIVTLLPEPDSPTMPSTSPSSSVRLTPSTACSTPDCGRELDVEVFDLEEWHVSVNSDGDRPLTPFCRAPTPRCAAAKR